MNVTLRGMDDAEKQMQRIERGTRLLGQYKAYVFSRLPYAYGMHEGRHQQSGRLARKAGGALYLRRAVDTVLSDADRDLSEGLNKVTAPGVWVLRRLGLWARRLSRLNAPRWTGHKSNNMKLYRSIKSEVRKG
jgi:hypothetical protein